MLYMVTGIPSIYPSHVSIYTSTMDPSWDIATTWDAPSSTSPSGIWSCVANPAGDSFGSSSQKRDPWLLQNRTPRFFTQPWELLKSGVVTFPLMCVCVYENLEKLVFVIGSTWSTYPLVNYDNYGKSPLFIDKSTINRPLPIATSNYQRVP